MPQRMNAGQPLVAIGAIALLISLFLDWYSPPFDQPGLSAWTAFELLDIVLAGLALVALAAALPIWPGQAGRATAAAQAWLPWLGAAALLFVAVSLANEPPATRGNSELDVGAWIGLAGAALMAIGGLLSTARISLVIGRPPGEAGAPPTGPSTAARTAGPSASEPDTAPTRPLREP